MGMDSNAGGSLSEMEMDAIGEILNISMGAAATAVSSMLDKQVLITTPKVSVKELGKLDYSSLEPAMIVKITYVKGITGSNIMVFRQKDMQYILNQLMGIDEPLRDDYVFDELSMSAACEVMNQMMGASATALSEFLGRSINISIPTAVIMDEHNTFSSTIGLETDNNVVAIFFDLSISDIMKSEFVCVMTCDLAKMIVNQFMHTDEESGQASDAAEPVEAGAAAQSIQPAEEPRHQPAAASVAAPPAGMPEPMPGHIPAAGINPQAVGAAQPIYPPQGMETPMPQYPQAAGYNPQAANPQMPGYQQPPGMNPMAAGYNPQAGAYGAQPPVYNPQIAGMNPQTAGIPGMQGTPYPPAVNPYMQPGQYQPQYPGYPPQMPQQYSPYPNTAPPVQGAPKEPAAPAENQILKQAVNVQNVQFPVFSGQQSVFSAPLSNGNIDMLMNVPLNVSIEIGRTKKKIRDIMDFNQGSIIELEKQAGAPVDIIVNGQLMARGDVVVIDDNFAVRITEIIGTKELISSVEGTAK